MSRQTRSPSSSNAVPRAPGVHRRGVGRGRRPRQQLPLGSSLPAAALAAGLLLGLPGPGVAQSPAGPGEVTPQETVAIVGGEVHTVAGDLFPEATVLIRDGRIAAVGTGVEVPGDARVVDASGKVVTPGLLDSATRLGLVEIGAASGTVDSSTDDPRITAAFHVAAGINPATTVIPINRSAGITRAVVAPGTGSSLIAGQGVLIDLGGARLDEMVHVDPVGVFGSLGESGARLAGGARGAALLQLREALQDARDYRENREAFQRGERRPYAPSRLDLEALVPVLDGQVPLVLDVHRASDILAALELEEEFGVRLVLTGVLEGWKVADDLARAGVPVVTNPLINLPGFESLGATYENAARMHAAGVEVILSSFDTHNVRNLRQGAGNAVAHGMPHEAALRAVTLLPARVWGVADRFGSLEPGKDADLVVWSGDPFELLTTAEHVFIRGREMPPDHRQRALFQRYRDLEGIPPRHRPE